MSLSSEPVQTDVEQPVVTTEQGVNAVAASGTEKTWKRWKYPAAISAVAVPALLAIGSALQLHGENSHAKKTDVQPAAAKAQSSESEERSSTEEVSDDPAIVVEAKPDMTPEQCKELAEQHWKNAQVASVCVGIENRLQEMDTALLGAGLTREDVGATPEAIQGNYLRLAKEEWERAKVLSIPVFRAGALAEMRTALKKADVDIDAIGVTEEMVQNLEPQTDKSDLGGE